MRVPPPVQGRPADRPPTTRVPGKDHRPARKLPAEPRLNRFDITRLGSHTRHSAVPWSRLRSNPYPCAERYVLYPLSDQAKGPCEIAHLIFDRRRRPWQHLRHHRLCEQRERESVDGHVPGLVHQVDSGHRVALAVMRTRNFYQVPGLSCPARYPTWVDTVGGLQSVTRLL